MRCDASARRTSLFVIVAFLLAVGGCSDRGERPDREVRLPDPVIEKGLGPGPTAEFETSYEGEVLPGGNSWELPVKRGREARFTVRMKIRSGGQVCRSSFHVSEFDAPSNETVRRLRSDSRTLGPGTYAYPLSWDGRDNDGELLPPGSYRLSVMLKTDQRDCTRARTTEGGRLGQFLLGDTEGEPRYVPPVPA